MTIRTDSMWISAAIAGCLAAGLPQSAMAQQPEAPPPVADFAADAEDDSDVAENEGYLPTPVTLADLLPSGRRPQPFLFGVRGEHQFNTDIDDAGEFSVTRFTGAGAVMFPLGQRMGGLVGGAYSHACYDFDDAAAFAGGEPWGDIQSVHFGGLFKYLVTRQWSVIGGGFGSFSGENNADSSSSFTGGGAIGAGYRASEDFYVQLGVAVYSQLEDDVSVLPAFRLNWRIDEHWRLRAGVLETGATDSVGVGLVYHFDDHWAVGARMGYIGRRFRLNDDGFAPEGIGEDEQYRGALSLFWEPNHNVQVVIAGGMTFAGSLRVEDEDGNRLFREDYDPGPFVSARLGFRF